MVRVEDKITLTPKNDDSVADNNENSNNPTLKQDLEWADVPDINHLNEKLDM